MRFPIPSVPDLHDAFAKAHAEAADMFEGLADGVARHFDPGVLDALIAQEIHGSPAAIIPALRCPMR